MRAYMSIRPLAHLCHTLYNPPAMDNKQLEMEQVLREIENAIQESRTPETAGLYTVRAEKRDRELLLAELSARLHDTETSEAMAALEAELAAKTEETEKLRSQLRATAQDGVLLNQLQRRVDNMAIQLRTSEAMVDVDVSAGSAIQIRRISDFDRELTIAEGTVQEVRGAKITATFKPGGPRSGLRGDRRELK